MIRLANLIARFEDDFLDQYGDTLLPSQRRALGAMKTCRTRASRHLQLVCNDCRHTDWIPHSCGHRACPHCQHHEAEQWLHRQRQRQLPVRYFLVTFTLPRQLRRLAWAHQRRVYDAMIGCSWQTIAQFARNDRQLHGRPAPSRCSTPTPAASTSTPRPSRCPGRRRRRQSPLLANPALQTETALSVPAQSAGQGLSRQTAAGVRRRRFDPAGGCPENWVVDCKAVGSGEKALLYLSRYLYRGVLLEKQIVACDDGQVTFRYRDGKTGRYRYRTETGARFIALLLRHVLPKGFRRARNYGFLHPNRKRLIALLQLLLPAKRTEPPPAPRVRPPISCPCCGKPMTILRIGVLPINVPALPPPPLEQGGEQAM